MYKSFRTKSACFQVSLNLVTTRYFEKSNYQETCIVCNFMASNPIRSFNIEKREGDLLHTPKYIFAS